MLSINLFVIDISIFMNRNRSGQPAKPVVLNLGPREQQGVLALIVTQYLIDQ